MGRHSRPDASGPATEPSRWGGLLQRVHHDDSSPEAPPEPGDVLTRPIDQTQVIARVPAAAWTASLAPPAAPAAPPGLARISPGTTSRPTATDETAVFVLPMLDQVAASGARINQSTPPVALEAPPPAALEAPPPAVETPPSALEAQRPAMDEPSPALNESFGALYEPSPTLSEPPLWGEEEEPDPPISHQRWMWPALVVFWLLALGAGIISLASLGAPHYLCTGAAKGLACHRVGTAIAAVLTVVVIAVVGVVSVFAIEARRRGLVWLRYLGIGVLVLAVVAGGGYLLIRTIGG